MRRFIIFLALLLLGEAGAVSAREPLIVFYNNYAPQPSLELVSIKPQNQATFQGSPGDVEVSFTQSIVPEKSDLKVFDQYNNPVGAPKTMSKDNHMEVALPSKMLAEVYRIEWNATCACTGQATINGTAYFTVY